MAGGKPPKEILVGNTAYVRITWVPSSGLSNVTAITLSLEDADGNVTSVTPSNPSTNVFVGSHLIPDAGPIGRWKYRAEVTSGPPGAHEVVFDVIGSNLASP